MNTTEESKRSKYQKFEAQEIHRAQIQNAPYNPRRIKDAARAKIKKNLKTVGLLSTLVWNKRSGNLVSGHQRLSQLDALEGTEDYTLTVAVVDLDDKTEKEQNIFFNSTTAQGYFDFDMLLEVLPDVDYQAAGFDDNDLRVIGFEYEAAEFNSPQAKSVQDEINEIYDTGKESNSGESYEARKQKVLDSKARQKEIHEGRVDEGETYVTLSFQSFRAKAEFMRRMGYAANDIYLNGEKFAQQIERV